MLHTSETEVIMYMVVEIIEPDFGCEGIPDGQEPRCEVVLENENGKVIVTVPDAELYRKEIYEGVNVEYRNNIIQKV